jgi:hypothetical protein
MMSMKRAPASPWRERYDHGRVRAFDDAAPLLSSVRPARIFGSPLPAKPALLLAHGMLEMPQFLQAFNSTFGSAQWIGICARTS